MRIPSTVIEICRLNETVPYEALSYCWGAPHMESVIDCSQGCIPITMTLDHALRVLRRTDVSRRLWIDQICINQKNNTERSSQVRLMHRIYSGAKRTIVWLGEDDREQGPIVQELLNDFRKIGAICHGDGYFTTTPPSAMSPMDRSVWGWNTFKWYQEDELMFVNQGAACFPQDDILLSHGLPARSSKAWAALNTFLQSDYFTRVWTLQEVLSSQECLIKWGATELPWASVRGPYRWALVNHCMFSDLFQQSPSVVQISFFDLEISWYRGVRFEGLAKFVTSGREGFEATDPRDHIYAFTSLAPDGKDFQIDYEKPEKDVFIDFSKFLILQSGNLASLNLAGLHRDEGFDLPSWVPNWGSRRAHWISPAGGNRFAKFRDAPFFPLAEEGHQGPSGIVPGYSWSTEDLPPPAGSTAKVVAGRSGQLLVKGFQLPGDQIEIICTRLAYSTEDPAWIHIAAQYQELSHACASPTAFLRAMLNCMTIAKRKWRGPEFNDKYLLAEFTSIIIDSISPSRFANSMDRLVPGLRLIALASDAMESVEIPPSSIHYRPTISEQDQIKCAIRELSHDGLSEEKLDEFVQKFSDRVEAFEIPSAPTLPQFTISTQDHIKTWIRQLNSNQLSQEELDKVIKQVMNTWDPTREADFKRAWTITGVGRKLFVTTQGRVGIGPARMSATDIIIIAYGGKTPYVLRPVPGTQEYSLIGDCYIHCLMDGSTTAVPKDDDPPADWFCLGGKPGRTENPAVASNGSEGAED